MPGEAFKWMSRIRAVEREYEAIRFATDLLIFAVKDDPSILVGHVRRPEIGTASVRLEGTYVIRVFAEFETALRHFILAFHIRRPRAAETLINRVRDRGHIPQPMTDAVHRVREYRNILVHERLAPVAPVTIRDNSLPLHVSQPSPEHLVIASHQESGIALLVNAPGGVSEPCLS